MKKKLVFSVLMSVGIVVGAAGLAYAIFTFNASQQGFRQAGEGQSARLTIQLEAGTPDGESGVLPDGPSCTQTPCPGGALSFTITNTSDFPIVVESVTQRCLSGSGLTCVAATSNKNDDGSYGYNPGSPNCGTHVTIKTPNLLAWPTIASRSTLHVNGSDGNQLGAGMLHLNNNTPDGCQGALFFVGLTVTATEGTNAIGAGGEPNP